MNGWERKAHATIAAHAKAAWVANKRRPGYRLPEVATALVKALGMHDRVAAEHEVKRLFEVERLGAWTRV